MTKVARNCGLQGVRDDVGRKKATEMMTAIRGWKKRTESVQERHKKTHCGVTKVRAIFNIHVLSPQQKRVVVVG